VEQFRNKIIAGYVEVLCDVGQNSGQRANPKRTVLRDCDVVFPVLQCSEAKMTSSVPGYLVAEHPQRADKILAGEIAG
jgi:hypothetical protein